MEYIISASLSVLLKQVQRRPFELLLTLPKLCIAIPPFKPYITRPNFDHHTFYFLSSSSELEFSMCHCMHKNKHSQPQQFNQWNIKNRLYKNIKKYINNSAKYSIRIGLFISYEI